MDSKRKKGLAVCALLALALALAAPGCSKANSLGEPKAPKEPDIYGEWHSDRDDRPVLEFKKDGTYSSDKWLFGGTYELLSNGIVILTDSYGDKKQLSMESGGTLSYSGEPSHSFYRTADLRDKAVSDKELAIDQESREALSEALQILISPGEWLGSIYKKETAFFDLHSFCIKSVLVQYKIVKAQKSSVSYSDANGSYTDVKYILECEFASEGRSFSQYRPHQIKIVATGEKRSKYYVLSEDFPYVGDFEKKIDIVFEPPDEFLRKNGFSEWHQS